MNKIINKLLRMIYRKNDRKYIELQFENMIGYKPNLDNPKSFNEKINWIKLNYYNELYEKCADKIEVRGICQPFRPLLWRVSALADRFFKFVRR